MGKPMPGSKQVAIRFPRDLVDALEACARESGATLSEVVRSLVNSGLNPTPQLGPIEILLAMVKQDYFTLRDRGIEPEEAQAALQRTVGDFVRFVGRGLELEYERQRTESYRA